jgi:hypothetical protein
MILSLRNKQKINILNVVDKEIDVVNGIYAVCNQPMFAGQTVKFYSYAEHSCHIYDYINENFDELMEKFSKNVNGFHNPSAYILSLTKKSILLYSLLYNMPHPLLFPFMGNFKETSYGINIIRIRGAILRGLGHNKNDFNVALPLIEYVDKIMQKDLMDDYYNKDAKYMYHEPADVVLMFISRFNQCAPYQLYLLNKCETTQHLTRYVQAIRIK